MEGNDGMIKIECFKFEESENIPNTVRIVPIHENFHLDSTNGSFNIIFARLMGLTYANYLRMCRDVLGAQIVGKNQLYPVAYFTRGSVADEFLKVLNNKANLVLADRRIKEYENHT